LKGGIRPCGRGGYVCRTSFRRNMTIKKKMEKKNPQTKKKKRKVELSGKVNYHVFPRGRCIVGDQKGNVNRSRKKAGEWQFKKKNRNIGPVERKTRKKKSRSPKLGDGLPQ